MADKKETKAAEKKPEKKGSFLDSVKNFFGRIGKYLKDTKSELKKVSWPSKKQIKNNTIVVIIVIAVAAAVLILLDFLFGGIMQLLIGT